MPQRKNKRISGPYYTLLGISSIVYVALTLLAPVKNNTFNIPPLQLHLIQLSFALPILIIWFLIVFGGVRFKNYALLIKSGHDGEGLNYVANALLILGFAGIVTSLISVGAQYLDVQYSASYIISKNYLAVVIQIVTYAVLYLGSLKLLRSINSKGEQPQRSLIAQYLVVLLISVYTAMMFSNQYRNSSPDPSRIVSFFLPDILLLLTIIVPYALVWVTATAALVNLRAYAHEVKGVVYRQAIQRLVLGLTLVVSFAIALGILSSLSSLFVGASLKFILVFVYVILILYAAGFMVIASGARRLNRIEEV